MATRGSLDCPWAVSISVWYIRKIILDIRAFQNIFLTGVEHEIQPIFFQWSTCTYGGYATGYPGVEKYWRASVAVSVPPHAAVTGSGRKMSFARWMCLDCVDISFKLPTISDFHRKLVNTLRWVWITKYIKMNEKVLLRDRKRNIPPSAYPVLGVCYPGRVSCPGTWLGYPPPHPSQDWDRGSPFPLEKDLDQRSETFPLSLPFGQD